MSKLTIVNNKDLYDIEKLLLSIKNAEYYDMVLTIITDIRGVNNLYKNDNIYLARCLLRPLMQKITTLQFLLQFSPANSVVDISRNIEIYRSWHNHNWAFKSLKSVSAADFNAVNGLDQYEANNYIIDLFKAHRDSLYYENIKDKRQWYTSFVSSLTSDSGFIKYVFNNDNINVDNIYSYYSHYNHGVFFNKELFNDKSLEYTDKYTVYLIGYNVLVLLAAIGQTTDASINYRRDYRRIHSSVMKYLDALQLDINMYYNNLDI